MVCSYFNFRKKREEKNINKIRKVVNYWPLISLVSIAALAGLALCYNGDGGMLQWMHYFMGFLFCQFSLLKLFDVRKFADGFQMYDIIAKRSRFYALIYPMIELILGLAYLSLVVSIITYLLTILLMLNGSIGVMIALKKGLDIDCPCMGTILKVPLSTVTLIEDLSMGAMAFILLIIYF